MKKVAGTVTEELYFDGADCVGELYSVTGDSPITVNYVTPSLDENITMTRGSSDYYYTQDGLGSVRELLDASQTTQNTYDYEAFGSFYGTPTENVVNRYTYTGREWDNTSSSYYYRDRNYSQKTGRFIQKDKIRRLNQYTYTSNCPTRYIDPTGLWNIDIHYYMTKYLAKVSGCFTPSEQHIIAEFDQLTDEEFTTYPSFVTVSGAVERRWKYHAFGKKGRELARSLLFDYDYSKKDSKYGSCSVAQLGRHLHTIQDLTTHGRKEYPALYGHLFHGHSTDIPGTDLEQLSRATRAYWLTARQLLSFLEQCRECCDIKKAEENLFSSETAWTVRKAHMLSDEYPIPYLKLHKIALTYGLAPRQKSAELYEDVQLDLQGRWKGMTLGEYEKDVIEQWGTYTETIQDNYEDTPEYVKRSHYDDYIGKDRTKDVYR